MGYARATSSARSRACCRRSSTRGVRGHRQRRRREPGARAREAISSSGRARQRGEASCDRRRHGRRPASASRRTDRARPCAARTWIPASRCRPCAIACYRPTRIIGSTPIVEALSRGAQCRHHRPVDRHGAHDGAASRHEFGWARGRLGPARRRNHRRAHHRVRRAVLGRQLPVSTGADIPDLANVGYPIVEAHPPTGRSRSRSIRTPAVASRFRRSPSSSCYEMGDPHAYITPDVVADFTTIQLEADGPGPRARVRHQRATARPTSSKCRSRIAPDSRRSAPSSYAWPDALREGAGWPTACCASGSTDLGLRVRHDPHRVRRRVGHAWSARRRSRTTPPEVQLRVRRAWRPTRPTVERFTREIAPLVLNGPPSVTGLRRRTPEGRGDRRLLARAHRQDRSSRRTSRCVA